MDVNQDFKELLSILKDCRARFLVVGAHAVAYHTEPRFTKDIDLWVEPTPANSVRVLKALAQFGAPLQGVDQEDFTNPQLVYQIGVEPNRIDIMMGIEGVTFPVAWRNRVRTTYGGVPVSVLCKKDLVRSKRMAGRPQDLLDVQRLTSRAGKPKRRRRQR